MDSQCTLSAARLENTPPLSSVCLSFAVLCTGGTQRAVQLTQARGSLCHLLPTPWDIFGSEAVPVHCAWDGAYQQLLALEMVRW